jgi:chitodextrinase
MGLAGELDGEGLVVGNAGVRRGRWWGWRLLAALVVVAAIPLAGAARVAHADVPVCQTGGPAGGSYTVTLCVSAPSAGATVSGLTSIAATVSRSGTAPPGAQRVVFYLDGQYLLTDYSSSYTFVLPTDSFVDGTHLLEVEALMRDAFKTGRTGISLRFQNGVSVPPVNTKSFSPTPGTTPAAGQPVVVAAVGDGAGGEQGETDVVNLIQSWNPNLFLYLGDVYEKGTMAEFYNWYGTSSLYGGLRSITDPAIGNHEYSTGQPAGYFDYWDNVPHYYSVNVGSWHIVSLDSTNQFGQAQPGTAQYDWLANDLRRNFRPCTLVYYHHPVFNIGQEGYHTTFNNVWALLDQYHVDIVLNGHDHTYQRWQPLNGSGTPSANGVTEFVAGTGGHSAGDFVTTDSRLAASATGFGALQLTLNAGGAGYAFVSTSHAVVDSGSISCRTTNDTLAPSVPGGLAAVPASRTQVDLSWSPALDNVGVTGYDLYRDGTLLASLGPQTNYSDTTVLPSSSYSYQVRARDAAGNLSALSSPVAATTPATGSLFAEGFESGDLSKWTTVNGLVLQQSQVFSGSWGAEASGNGTTAYGWKDLGSPRNELYLQLHFKVLSQGANSIYLARLRTVASAPLVTLYVSSTGKIGYRNELTGIATTSSTTAASGAWHTAQLHVLVNNDASTVEVWLDGAKVDALSNTVSFGTSAIERVELGDSATSQSYDVVYDDVAYDSGFIGDSTPPSTPTNLVAVARSGLEVDLSWSASADDIGVGGYDVYRNGAKIGQVDGSATSYADSSVDPLSYYFYSVRARDAAGNASPVSGTASLTTPDLFADNFETGDLSRWSSVNGLLVQQDDVFAGSQAARAAGSGAPASSIAQFARTVDTLDARVEFKLESQGANSATLLRFRTAAAASLVSVYVSSTGKLGLRNDVTGIATTSTTTVSSGVWHLLELHALVGIPASRVDVLLDGAGIAGLTGPATLGTAPIGRLELGESATNRTFSVAFDNLVANTSFSGNTTAPSAPSGLTAHAVSGTEIDLGWNAATDDVAVAGYRVNRDGTPLADTAATTYNDTAAQPGTSYTYTVQAFDAAGNLSDASNAATAEPLDTTPPDAPTGLTATAASATRVDLSWTDATDNVGIDHYVVLRGGVQIGRTSGPATGYSDLAVTGTTTYTYTVEAADAAGNISADSSPATATTPDGTPPTAPTNVWAFPLAANRVFLAWGASTDNVGVTGYTIYRNGTKLADVTSRLYLDISAQPSTTYSYTVTAFDAVGNESLPGGPVTAKTFADTSAPTAPTGLKVGAQSAGEVDLVWNASTDNVGVAGYSVFRNNVKLGNVTSNGFADKTAVQGVSYTYTVKAFDAAGNVSGASNSISVVPDWTPPSAPTGLKATSVSKKKVDLTWNASSDNVKVSAYRVFRDGVSIADVTSRNYTDKSAPGGATVTYTVKALDAAGNLSSPSNALTVNVPA